MGTGTDVLPLDDSAAVWQQLSDRVERFVAAWEADPSNPPSPAEYLAGTLPSARRLTAIELIKVDLEYRWSKRREPRPLEFYFAQFDFLADDPPVDLIYEECHVRRQAGETFDNDEPCRRFPQQAAALRRLLGAASVMQTTMLTRTETVKTSKLEPGERIDDFELLIRLGEGAFGTVFLARQVSMQRIVALKATADRGSEPQTLAQLDHEHIVRVYDQRQVASRGLRLMYMQYAAGGTLADALDRLKTVPLEDRTGAHYLAAVDAMLSERGESPPAESGLRARLASMPWPAVVCWIGSRLARALDYAHRIGVLHRDLKPANVLLTAEGSPKLADFNISYSSKVEGATPAAYFGGSLAYMSPEQLEACSPSHDRKPEDLDARSDLYSLGVVLCELLTGLRPFDDHRVDRSWSLTLEQMMVRRRAGPAASQWAMLVREAAPGLDRVLAKCLQPDPADRYESGEAFADHLELCLHPNTQRLLTSPERGFSLASRDPAATIVALTILPNLAAGVFNYIYNHAEIVPYLPEATAEDVFQRTQMTINLSLFPLGGLVGYWRSRRVGDHVGPMPQHARLSNSAAAELRRRCLLAGRDAAIISLSLWVLAGVMYPLLMHWWLGRVSAMVYLHFFSSLVLCGMVAAAYPFFIVTLFSLRRLYPRFVRLGAMGSDDVAQLEAVRRRTWFYLSLAGLVPMMAVMILTMIGSSAEYALKTSAIVGMIGFAGALTMVQKLQADVDCLVPLMQRRRTKSSQSFD